MDETPVSIRMTPRLVMPVALAGWVLLSCGVASRADDSALVRLLKSGRVPADRQPQIVAKIGQLGNQDDLSYLLQQSLDPKGFAPEVRVKALDALADAALTRKGIAPSGDLGRLRTLIVSESDARSRVAAIRLAGLWKVEAVAKPLVEIAEGAKTDDAVRAAALDALAMLGPSSLPTLEQLALKDRPPVVRSAAIAAIARLAPKEASGRAAEFIRDAAKDQDLSPMMASILDHKEGAATLAGAIDSVKLDADHAKLALRALYTLGRADAPLVAALSKAAGIEADTKPPTKEEMDKLVAEVQSQGNSERGERVFRRADLNCMKCHAISGAAGGVGPDLSSVGLSSPVDYIINSILLPDQAIKEQYHTLVVATNDGQVFQGIVADKDESKVVLKQATGELKTVPASEIDESKEGGSLMPKGLANLLTHDEFINLVRFLSELGKPGRYAIRDTPTIQRWSLMTSMPQELAGDAPDAGTFVSKVRDSDPSAWAPAYGLATGDVPIDEFTQVAKSPVVYIRGQIDVSAGGELNVDIGSQHGVNAWLDDAPVNQSQTRSEWKVMPGKHTITLRVDTRDRKPAGVKVTVAKAPGSSAEFVVVGGR